MDQSELVDLVLADLGKRTDLTSDASNAVSMAVKHYQRERFWFLETITAISTTSSVAYYAMPSDYGGQIDTLMINVSNRRQAMKRVHWQEIDEKDDGATYGQPSEYAYYGDQLRVYPTPDKTYTLRASYSMVLDAPSLSGSNVWTIQGADLIKARASWLMWSGSLLNPQQAQASKAEEMEAYNSLMRQTTQRLSTGRIQRSGF